METLFSLVPLIVFLPVIGLLINIAFGGKMGEKAIGAVASTASGLAFVVSALLGVALLNTGGRRCTASRSPTGSASARLQHPLDLPRGHALGNDDAGRFRCRHAHSRLRHWLHARGCAFQKRRGALQPFLRLLEPVHCHDDDPGQRRLVPDAVLSAGRA